MKTRPVSPSGFKPNPCLFLLVFSLFTLHFSLFAQQRGMKPVTVNIESQPVVLYKSSYALLIGASAYRSSGVKPLPGVRADITAVKAQLELMGFLVVTVMDPDKEGLLDAFNDFIARYGQDPESRLLIYYAGHGYTRNINGNEIGYLLPVDCPTPERDLALFQKKALPMDQIETFAKQIVSKHALFLFDACFSGAVFAQSRDLPGIISYKTAKPVRQFITSGSPDETVPDNSIFRPQLIEGLQGEADLNGDGYITGSELGDFLETTVVNYSKNSLHPQKGKIRDPKLDKGDFVFALNKVEKGVEPTTVDVVTIPIEKKPIPRDQNLPEMVYVEGGTFQMGSNESDEDEKPVHQVTVSSFYMGKYEVTVKQFGYFIGKTGYRTDAEKGDGSFIWTGSEWAKRAGVNWRHDEQGKVRGEGEMHHPVVHVSWNDAVAYCEWLGRETGKSYQLPTEAQWEYAAGNGSKHTRYSWGNSDPYGKWGGNVADETAKRNFPSWTVFSGYSDGYVFSSPVGSFEANEFGLHDMSGNVWEWCSDWKGDYPSGAQVNPNGPSTGAYRVNRGGGWYGDPRFCRSSGRGYSRPDYRSGSLGFRLVLVP